MKKKIGFVGLGKLGLPVSLAIEAKGYQISAYDISPKVNEIISKKNTLIKKNM